jgi:membrane protein DedA with SNARE-associated domain
MHWLNVNAEISLGIGIVFAATVLEFLGLPAPGGPLLVLAAAAPATSSTGTLFLTLVAGIGAATGDAPWYFLGRFGGKSVLRVYCKFTLGSATCVANTQRFFDRFGILTLAFSKFFPGVRLFAPPFAGATGYPLTGFLYLDLVGGFLWAGALALFGRILRAQISWAFNTEWIWAFTFAPVAIFLLARLVKRMIKGPADDAFPIRPRQAPANAKAVGTKGMIL